MNRQYFLAIIFLLTTLNLWSQNTEKTLFLEAITQKDATLKQVETAKKLKPFYSTAVFHYYRLLMIGLPKNAYLITNSVDDTYPLRILQILEKFRTDITVISLKLNTEKKYNTFINTSLDLKLKSGDTKGNIQQIIKKYSNTIISTTVQQVYWQNYYLNGLVAGVRDEHVVERLNSFYRNYLNANILQVNLTKADALLYKNILPPLITLYKMDGTLLKLKKDILLLAKKLAVEKEVELIIANE